MASTLWTTLGRVRLSWRHPFTATPDVMTSPSPLLRLFAVCWWLLVIGSAGLALLGTWALWEHYHSPAAYTHPLAGWTPAPPDPSFHVAAGAVVLPLSLLPFIIVTVVRRIVTARWRYGPRW